MPLLKTLAWSKKEELRRQKNFLNHARFQFILISTDIYYSAKKRQQSFDTVKSFLSSDTHQSMKTSDSDLKVNLNINFG